MNDKIQSGHPPALYVLFFSEMWERFCYYGMRTLLMLYLVKSLAMGDAVAAGIYGAYTALVYAAPVVGGKIADELLGYRRAVVFGGILMAIGEFMLLGGTATWLYAGMGVIIVGNGYFKANISSIVGQLYDDGDPRKDSGFTIFYIGINVGALLATTVCAWVGETYGFEYGFGLAGIGMLLGVGIFLGGSSLLEGRGMPPNPERLHEKVAGPLTRNHVAMLLSILAIPVLFLLIKYNEFVGYFLGAVAAYVLFTLLAEAFKSDKVQRDRLFVLIILMFFNIVFWASFEQAGTSLTLFADRNVDRDIFGWVMPASMTQFFNPFYIVVLGSVFSVMWIALDKRGLNPNIPLKFGIGIMFVAVGFLLVIPGVAMAGDSALVPLLILAFLYMFHTTGELFLSPIGLSMVTKLAPKHMVGTVMGAWFLTFAGANYLAALIAAQMSVGGGHGGGGGEETAALTAQETLPIYAETFTTIGWAVLAIGAVLSVLSFWLNKMMHGVK